MKRYTLKKFFKNRNGQSLIEIAVALGVLTILLTVAATAVTQSVNNAQESKYQNQASIYAAQGLEVLRQMRDSDYSAFANLNGTYCMELSCTELTASGICGKKITNCGANADIFTREVIVNRNDISCGQAGNLGTKAKVVLSWRDSKCAGGTDCRQVVSETCFSNPLKSSGF